MIRVAFELHVADGWLGGLNYFRNLLCAIAETPNMKICPVIFIGKRINRDLLKGFPEFEFIESNLLDRWTCAWIKRKIDNKLFSRDRFLDNLFKKHTIDILSHIGHISGSTETPLLGWIPDFQHIRLPNFFTKQQLAFRDKSFRDLCALSKGIILSSYDAKKDLLEFAPEYKNKAHVLQFVVQPPSSDIEPTTEEIEHLYGFCGKYLYVPNQFWLHKNHKVLLEALSILKKQDRKILIISTGSTADFRMPGYYDHICQFIKEHELSDRFRILGKVPYSHVVSLAKNSISLINPSLFEGWSTTVEEAKSLGKKIILSDIPVHKEQNPPGGIYFDPNNPEKLAEILWIVWHSNTNDNLLKVEAQSALEQRRLKFAKTYEQIIIDTIKQFSL